MTDSSARLAGRSVSRETSERLALYENLLRKWNPAINLVARSTLDALWDRHFRDSIQVFDLAPVTAKNGRIWAVVAAFPALWPPSCGG